MSVQSVEEDLGKTLTKENWKITNVTSPLGKKRTTSGLDTIELTYHNGKKFRISTDEPEVLLEALKVV